MELNIGDLVRHKKHGFYGIVVSNTSFWGDTIVCKVEWVESGKNHIIDVFFLDKIKSQ